MSMTGSGSAQNMTAHHAVQMIRQSHSTIQQNMMMQRSRSAFFTVVVPAPKTTSLGLVVTRTFTINQSEPLDGDVREYELFEGDKLIWSGMGDDPVDALLEAIMKIANQDKDLPND